MAPRPDLAPIALFAYMRPDHLKVTVESLQANAEAAHSHLHVFCDAPKRAEHAPAVQAVRRYAEGITGFASVNLVLREANLGLARSIIDGVSRLTAQHGRVIVVEDDLLLSPHFLRYMNDGLDCYADDDCVASIHGYCFPVREPLPETFFLRGTDCWGWATWQRAWAHFRPDGAALLDELQKLKLTKAFNMDGSYPYVRMLKEQIRGKNDSWAIRWHASCYIANMLTLFPGRSLVHNIGNDNSGTHCETRIELDQKVSLQPIKVRRQALEASLQARRAFVDFLNEIRPGILERASRIARKMIRRWS